VRLWADHWARAGFASAAIRLKLSAKGFDEGVINNATSQLCPPSDDEERARLVLAQHARRATARLARARLARTLASRGFDSDLIERLLNESV
jgi:SOS response regulatory protein OraA/RecX